MNNHQHIQKSSQTCLRRFFIYTISLFSLFTSCTTDLNEVKEKALTDPNALNETGENVEILYTKDAKPSIKIKAKKAIRHETEEPYTEFTEGMELFVYNDLGDVESVLTANYGKMNDGSTEMLAKDDVIVINESGEQLNTEELIWDQEAAKIRSEGFVKITTPTEIIYGNGFEANDNFTEYTIFNITGTVQIEDDSF